MRKTGTVNLITFARGRNQFHELDYMTSATKNQVELFKEHGFRSTVLLMYDALIEPEFSDYVKKQVQDGFAEAGVWFEIPEQLVSAAGLEWRGREGYTWDWFNDVGFLIGYTPAERILLIDEVMNRFRDIFGFYPAVAGSWHIDSFSLNYLHEKYNVKGTCMCRDQWGTDGYTIWGGYEPVYYPSKNNMLCPASTAENQINMPVLRMLGEDPLYQFDIPYMREKWNYSEGIIGQITLEPTILSDGKLHGYSGMDRNWSDWYFRILESTLTAPFAYAQTGQENGFGWFRIENGMRLQCDLLDKHVRDGLLTVETMGETCERFSSTYEKTPCSTVAAQEDWMGCGRKAYWYYSPYYRSSVLYDNGCAWIRELRLFDENYREVYLDTPCREQSMAYDNLPLSDGTLWSVEDKSNIKGERNIVSRSIPVGDKAVRAGIYPVTRKNGCRRLGADGIKAERTGDTMKISWQLEEIGGMCVEFSERRVEITLPDGAALMMIHNGVSDITGINERSVSYAHRGYAYSMHAQSGSFAEYDGSSLLILPEQGKITIAF